ncbi:MAG: Gfo/Idh/MocA family oxidoreductase [Bryobacteraceae bacterium]
MSMNPDRRTFLQTATLGAVASLRAIGANDKVNVAVIGLGGRGRNHMTEYAKLPEANIGALCDVDQAALERGIAFVEKATGNKPKGYSDMRQVFADKSIDAVSMPIPNHWHSLATIWACQAGKDVYVEKPACHNVFEGKMMVEAARKYKRMVQIGSQSRSMPHKQKAIELLHQGVIGKVYLAKGLCYKRRVSIGHKEDSPTPPGVNWDMFLGPAPMRAFNELRFKYNWHWFWDTGNGDIGNQGVHEMDVARWGLGKEMPNSVVSNGGKYAYTDDQETPNTQIATFDYGDSELIFEVRGLITGDEGGLKVRGNNTIGNLFYGSDGYMAVDGDGFQVYKGEKREMVMEQKKEMADTGPHMANFLKAVKSRNHQDLNADVQIGVTSADLCHLANISYRTGRKLAFDPASGKFANDAEANKMLTREYRAPYVITNKV